MIFRVEDADKASAVLAEKGIHTVDQEEIASL